MTFSNRIPLAGAIPVLVVLALAAMMAVIAFGSTQRASAAVPAEGGACEISPVILDLLLDRYGRNANECDELDLAADTRDADVGTDDTWDLSGQDLTSFEITKDDKGHLETLTGADAVESAVNYIDLTGNPLTIDDVSLGNIPSRVVIKISAESNIAGFQVEETTITEGVAGYIAVAIPGQRADDEDDDDVQQEVTLNVTLTGSDIGQNLLPNIDLPGTVATLIDFGTTETDGTPTTRTLVVNSESESVIFYFPIKANKDNTNEEEWSFGAEIDESDRGDGDEENDGNLTDGGELALDEIEINVLDADAPVNGENERSEDVVAAIVALAEAAATANNNLYGGHEDFDDLTLKDLGLVPGLNVVDTDGDGEPLEELLAGDFEGLSGVSYLHLVGAGSLPSGIFAGVGGADDNFVEITFEANSPEDSDVEKVGNYRPSTLPAHIFADQENQQVIVLADDVDDKDKGTTSGLDAGLYTAEEEGNFFVMTNAATTHYVLGNKVIFGADADNAFDTPMIDEAADPNPQGNTVGRPGPGGGKSSESSRVARFAIPVPEGSDPDKDGGRTDWLFLFAVPNSADIDATALKAIAVVEISEDD